MIKSILKKLTPIRLLINYLRFLANYFYDLNRFRENSGTINEFKSQSIHEARLIFHYHQLEKGLSLKEPRVGFGVKKAEAFIKVLLDYLNKYGIDKTSTVCLNVLSEYMKFQKENNFSKTDLYSKIEKLMLDYPININEGGTKLVSKQEIYLNSRKFNFEDFTNSRYSIRNFAPGNVDLSLIEEAIRIAQKTPSVCNRQPWKVHVYEEKTMIKKVLEYQNGHRGFSEGIDKLILVTSDLNSFFGVGERNQAFIDGGMFSMSLVYGLHSLGVGTCCLNCSINYQTDKKLRDVAQIGKSEAIIMMIAVGNIPDELRVASSPRKELETVFAIH